MKNLIEVLYNRNQFESELEEKFFFKKNPNFIENSGQYFFHYTGNFKRIDSIFKKGLIASYTTGISPLGLESSVVFAWDLPLDMFYPHPISKPIIIIKTKKDFYRSSKEVVRFNKKISNKDIYGVITGKK